MRQIRKKMFSRPYSASFSSRPMSRQVEDWDLGLHPLLTQNCIRLGWRSPSPIQEAVIPLALHGRSILGSSETGSGKSAAYILPILHDMLKFSAIKETSADIRPSSTSDDGRGTIQNIENAALILAPTRELVEQIHDHFHALGISTTLNTCTIYGGVNSSDQVTALRQANLNVVIACPGRLLDLMKNNSVAFPRLRHLVVDEVDKMFEMGFMPELRQILPRVRTDAPKSLLPYESPDRDSALHQTQMFFFSATLPPTVISYAESITRYLPMSTINLSQGQFKNIPPSISHYLMPAPEARKHELLLELIQNQIISGKIIIFVRTKLRANQLSYYLGGHGVQAQRIHGGLAQTTRSKALEHFAATNQGSSVSPPGNIQYNPVDSVDIADQAQIKNDSPGKVSSTQIIIATDVLARGIDLPNVSTVVNFDAPSGEALYIHRVGRTGRAQSSGSAITFYDPLYQAALMGRIEKYVLERDLKPGGKSSHSFQQLVLQSFDYSPHLRSNEPFELPSEQAKAQKYARQQIAEAASRAREVAAVERSQRRRDFRATQEAEWKKKQRRRRSKKKSTLADANMNGSPQNYREHIRSRQKKLNQRAIAAKRLRKAERVRKDRLNSVFK